jgi:hypothetical protein
LCLAEAYRTHQYHRNQALKDLVQLESDIVELKKIVRECERTAKEVPQKDLDNLEDKLDKIYELKKENKFTHKELEAARQEKRKADAQKLPDVSAKKEEAKKTSETKEIDIQGNQELKREKSNPPTPARKLSRGAKVSPASPQSIELETPPSSPALSAETTPSRSVALSVSQLEQLDTGILLDTSPSSLPPITSSRTPSDLLLEEDKILSGKPSNSPIKKVTIRAASVSPRTRWWF